MLKGKALTEPLVCVCLCTAEEDLLCRSVWSEMSGTSASDAAGTRCRRGEELFSCSSYAPGGARGGDKIEVREGGARRRQDRGEMRGGEGSVRRRQDRGERRGREARGGDRIEVREGEGRREEETG